MPFPSFPLRDTAYQVPGIAFGTGSDWRSNPRPVGDDGIAPEVVDALVAAAKAGFRHFDCAENYRNEASVGAGLAAANVPREELFVTSKVHRSLGSVVEAVRKQLKMLKFGCLDLYLIHTPKAAEQAGLTLEEAWKKMEGLVDAGLVRSIGVSNYLPSDFDAFLGTARIKPAVNQISIYPYIYHAVLPTIEYCQKNVIRIEAYELASSIIRGSEKGGPLDPVLDDIVAKLADEGTSATPGQILLAWASAKGFVCVSTSSKPFRLQEYIAAGEISLLPAQVAAIDEAGKRGAEMGYGKYSSW